MPAGHNRKPWLLAEFVSDNVDIVLTLEIDYFESLC
jgi:hypothetical protein